MNGARFKKNPKKFSDHFLSIWDQNTLQPFITFFSEMWPRQQLCGLKQEKSKPRSMTCKSMIMIEIDKMDGQMYYKPVFMK